MNPQPFAPPPAQPVLPAPEVRFEPGFLRRVELLGLRIAGARERREGAGRTALCGGGEEFAGFRPYRPGEDLRALDWHLFARLDRPFVRVTRREARERWAILVDASASMGVGPPGKLQRAAETAVAIACAGLRMGASTRLFVGGARREEVLEFELRRRRDPAQLLAFLGAQRASGSEGLGALLRAPALFQEAGRVFALSDLGGLEPEGLLALARRGRQLSLALFLAPGELEPAEGGGVEWWDPEGGERLALRLDAATIERYRQRLEERLEHWRAFGARHAIAFGAWSSAVEFETVVRGLFGA